MPDTAARSSAPVPVFRVGDVLEAVVGPPANGGSNVAKIHPEAKVIFVEGGIEGETVRLRITRAKDSESFARGRVTDVVVPSEHRRRHPWPLADPVRGKIGGAELGHIEPAEQRRIKAKTANDALLRIGRFDESDLSLAGLLPDSALEVEIPSGSQGARTRIAFAVGRDGHLGMHPAGSADVIAVDDMPLAVDALRAPGLFRIDCTGIERLELSAGSDGVLALLVPEAAHRPVRGTRGRAPQRVSHDGRPLSDEELYELAMLIAEALDEHLASVPSAADYRVDAAAWWPKRQRLLPLVGEPLLAQFVRRPDGTDRVYRVTGDGFWQIHEGAPNALSAKAVEYVDPQPGERLADLYAGAGLFTGALIDAVPGGRTQVDSIEAYRVTSEDAAFNFRGDPGASVITSRVETALEGRSYDKILLDPSRPGAGAEAVDAILGTSPETITYISCDAASFARDARLLADGGYRLDRRELLDIYPDTHHVETIARFVRQTRR